MSNEQTNVVTKVVDLRHKAPDQAIHELMQAAKDGFAVSKVVTRFNHTHVYLEANASQVEANTTAKEEVVKEETPKEETPVKTTVKKTATKATPKKEETKVSE